jgi:hypothetical protein
LRWCNAPVLPAASNNGITGTWNPATISTAAAGTTTYTFTPDAGQCATATATVDVTVTGPVTPTFDPVGNLCIGATAPVLPAVSNNGINGTWNPATISTAAAARLLIHLLLMPVSVQVLHQSI